MILYFTGTGNSRAVARRLGELLGERVEPITPDMRQGRTVDVGGSRRLIWVFPVYSWGVPPYVLSVMRGIGLADSGLTHHGVMTCGDDCGLADRMWRKAVVSRGWVDGCVMSVQMPNNYVALPGFDVDSKQLEDKKLTAYPARVGQVAEAIAEAEISGRKITDIVRGSMAWFKSRLIYPWFTSHLMDPGRFAVSDACIACGKCHRSCPLGNITMQVQDTGNQVDTKRELPAWGGDCAGCLGCYHVCPAHAISFTRFTLHKGQYLYPQHPDK